MIFLWDQFNQRRATLIHKRLACGLTDMELAELNHIEELMSAHYSTLKPPKYTRLDEE